MGGKGCLPENPPEVSRRKAGEIFLNQTWFLKAPFHKNSCAIEETL